MYGCESWIIKKAEHRNWYFWTVVLEKTLESPLDWKKIQPVHPKGNQSWIVIERADAKAPKLYPPDAKYWLNEKDSDVGQDWRQEEKGMTEDGMVEWHHWLNEHQSEQSPGVDNGQGSPACCNPRCRKESDMSEWQNWKYYVLTLIIMSSAE